LVIFKRSARVAGERRGASPQRGSVPKQLVQQTKRRTSL